MSKVKAIFLDYTGTMVREDGEDSLKLIAYFMHHSAFTDPKEAVRLVWSLVKKYEKECYLESFCTESEIIDKIAAYCKENYSFQYEHDELHEIWERSWIYAPLYDDVKPFFTKCPVPIYVITNDGISYLEKSMEVKGLKPAGIISAEAVKAYKPHHEIFDEALRVSGCTKEEVLHVGDSITSDVKGALAAGINPVLIDRSGKAVCEEATVIHTMDELLEHLG